MSASVSMSCGPGPILLALMWGLLFLGGGGCRSLGPTSRWLSPSSGTVIHLPDPRPAQITVDAPQVGFDAQADCLDSWAAPWPQQGTAQQRAIRFFELAEDFQSAGDPRCTDYYFQAAVWSWHALTEWPAPVGGRIPLGKTYQAGLQGMLESAVRHGRWCGQYGVRVYHPGGRQYVPLVNDGGVWPIDQLREFHLKSPPQWPQLKTYYHAPGFGVPLVAVRYRLATDGDLFPEKFFPARVAVSATFLLRPREGTTLSEGREPSAIFEPVDFELALVNPLVHDHATVGPHVVPLARDLSASLEHQLAQQLNEPFRGFLNPARVDEEGLRFLEPYQRGKIPVVFVHGLISDPTVWAEMVNHLRAQTWFNQSYQVWGFNYATGSPFVTSAMRLRHDLQAAIDRLDPESTDPALQRIVLVGHSMGGLVSKLQITHSGDCLWSSVSCVPLESIRASGEVKQQLAERLYFVPSPNVQRVIYIATPHAGSSLAARGIGRVASALVQEDEVLQHRHQRLIQENPTAFRPAFRRRIPTSIDLLEPRDPTLQAIYDLPVSPHVAQHTILGTGGSPVNLGRSDGVVWVSSASHPSAESEHHVSAGHTGILDHEDTTREVARILLQHLHP